MPSNGRKRKRGSGHKKDFRDRAATFTSEDIISKSELEGDDVLSLPDLRTKSITEIQETAQEMGVENVSHLQGGMEQWLIDIGPVAEQGD